MSATTNSVPAAHQNDSQTRHAAEAAPVEPRASERGRMIAATLCKVCGEQLVGDFDTAPHCPRGCRHHSTDALERMEAWQARDRKRHAYMITNEGVHGGILLQFGGNRCVLLPKDPTDECRGLAATIHAAIDEAERLEGETPDIEDVLSDLAKDVPAAEWDKLPPGLTGNLGEHDGKRREATGLNLTERIAQSLGTLCGY